VELNFIGKLMNAPALLFGRHPFVVVGALGCLLGLVISGLLFWRWGKP
jgi:cell division protein FtsX